MTAGSLVVVNVYESPLEARSLASWCNHPGDHGNLCGWVRFSYLGQRREFCTGKRGHKGNHTWKLADAQKAVRR